MEAHTTRSDRRCDILPLHVDVTNLFTGRANPSTRNRKSEVGLKVWYVPELNVILTPPLNQGFTKLGTRRRSLASESARRTIPAAQPCSEKRGEIGAREAAVDNFDCYLMIPDALLSKANTTLAARLVITAWETFRKTSFTSSPPSPGQLSASVKNDWIPERLLLTCIISFLCMAKLTHSFIYAP